MTNSKNKLAGVLLAALMTVSAVTAPAFMTTNDLTESASIVQTIEANAAYSTGKYQVNTSSGINVRKSNNTSSAKVGAATNGTQFNVTKISGNWGYTNSIKCTNGTKSGWVCLDYCKKVSGDNYVTPLTDGGIYWISPACATGSVVDVSGVSNDDGANVHLWSKVNGTNQKNQQFKAIKKGNCYMFQAVHSGKVLDICKGETRNGGNVIQWYEQGSDNQLWYLCDAGGGYYYIKSKLNPNVVLDVNGALSGDGTNIHVWEYNSSNAQRFKFTPVNGTNNNNTTQSTKLSYGLYKNNSARITCGFDGYVNTKGRHEGIDISYYVGAPIYSLTDGEVVRVAYGSNGSKGLSTIAIYVPSQNKTVIYLHSAPSNLKAGQKITKGQQIGTQAWRGISSSSGSHTHVEVRNGRQGYASKSVNDYTLDNPNPTSFWKAMGYYIG